MTKVFITKNGYLIAEVKSNDGQFLNDIYHLIFMLREKGEDWKYDIEQG